MTRNDSNTGHHPTDDAFEQMLRRRLHDHADNAPTHVRDITDISFEPIVKRRDPRRRIAAVSAGIIALGGGLTLTGIAATGGKDGGANTPEAAVTEFVEAIENRDVLGALDVLDPGEADVLIDSVVGLIDEATRMGALSDDVDAGDVSGAEISVDGLVLSTELVATDLAVVSFDGGTADLSFDLSALPFTDGVRSQFDPADVADSGEQVDFATQDLQLATIQRGGTWYVSLGFSIAEGIRRGTDLPFPVEPPVAPVGFDSPAAAATEFWQRMADFDLAGAMSTAAPGEADALSRYAPLWLPGVDRSIGDMSATGVSVTVSGLEFDATGDGDRRSVAPTAYVVEGTMPPPTDDGFASFDPDAPTLVWSADGRDFYVFDVGVPIPDSFDGLEPSTEFPAELEDGETTYNSATLLADGSVQTYWTDIADIADTADDSIRPFRVEYRDGCTTSSGALVDDALRWSTSLADLEEVSSGVYRSCGGDGASNGINNAFSVLAIGLGSVAPELPTIQTVEVGGLWYVSPIGSIAEQIGSILSEVADGEVLSIDSPLAVYVYGVDRTILEQQLTGRTASELSDGCTAIVTVDGDGNTTGLVDGLTPQTVRKCTENDTFWSVGYSTDEYGGGEISVRADEPPPASTNVPDSTPGVIVESVPPATSAAD